MHDVPNQKKLYFIGYTKIYNILFYYKIIYIQVAQGDQKRTVSHTISTQINMYNNMTLGR